MAKESYFKRSTLIYFPSLPFGLLTLLDATKQLLLRPMAIIYLGCEFLTSIQFTSQSWSLIRTVAIVPEDVTFPGVANVCLATSVVQRRMYVFSREPGSFVPLNSEHHLANLERRVSNDDTPHLRCILINCFEGYFAKRARVRARVAFGRLMRLSYNICQSGCLVVEHQCRWNVYLFVSGNNVTLPPRTRPTVLRAIDCARHYYRCGNSRSVEASETTASNPILPSRFSS